MFVYPLIDRIRLGVQLPRIIRHVKPAERLYNVLDQYCMWYKFDPDTPYSEKWLLVGDLGYMEYNKHELRLYWDFNPTKINRNDELFKGFYSDVYSVLKLCNFAWYSRVDLALDMDLDLEKHILLSKTKQKEVIYLNSKKKESHYFGSRQSEVMFRFYDKEKEAKGGILPPHMQNMANKTRFEIEIKKRIDSPITVDYLLELIDDIVIIPRDNLLSQLESVTDLKTALVLAYILENNRMDLLNGFSRNTASRYKNIIAELDIASNNIIPIKVELDNIVFALNDFRLTYNIYDLIPLPF